MNKVSVLLLSLMVVGCAEVSFNKQPYDHLVQADLPKPTLRMDKELSGKDYSKEVTVSKDLPKPNLILDGGSMYTPSTRIQTRVISGGTNLPQFRAVPESEYYKGN